MTNRVLPELETLERRDTPSTTPTSSVLPAVQKIDHLVDRYDARADDILQNVTTRLSKGRSVSADLTKLDTLADKLDKRIDHIITNVFADAKPTGALKTELNDITSQTNAFESTVDALVKTVRADLTAKTGVTADLANLKNAIHAFDTAIDADLKTVRADVGGGKTHSEIIQQLVQVNQLLAQGDHDYKGRRALAVTDITTAIHELEHPHGGHYHPGAQVWTAEPQQLSDAELKQAIKDLQTIEGELTNKPGVTATIQKAINQLNLALSVK